MKTLKARSLASAALLSILACGNANASYNYFESYGYEDELNRCVEILRPILQLRDGDRVTYDVQTIDLRGPVYNFEIVTTLVDESGETLLDQYRVGCQANRWIEFAKLIERENAAGSPESLEALALNISAR